MKLDTYALVEAIFNQTLDGVFVVEFDKPIQWNQAIDTPQSLDALCKQQRITRVNRVILEQYRAEESQVVGHQPSEFFRHAPEISRRLLRDICGYGHARAITEEIRLDGSPVTIEGDYHCIYDYSGCVVGYFGIRRDITEQAKLTRQLTLLNEIARQIAAALSVNEVIQRAAALTHQLLGYHHVGIFLLNPTQDALMLKACAGIYADHYPKNYQLAVNQGIVGWVAAHGKTRLCNDTRADSQYINLYSERVPSRAELSVPIEMNNNLLGVLDVQSPTTHAFSESDQTTLQTLADQIAIALENTQLTENLRTLFNGVDDMIFILDEQGNVLDTNHAAQQRLGYSELEIKALNVLNLHPANRYHEVQEIMTDLLAGRTNLCTVPLYTHSGALIYVETQMTRGTWQGKNALFGVARDIGESIRSEQQLAAIFRLSPNPIAILQRASGRILAHNPAFEQFFGVANSTQIDEIWLNPNNFATPEQYRQTAEQLRTAKTLLNHQITLYDAQKQCRVVLLNSNPIDFHGEDGNLIILSDLTEHLQAEQQLQQQLERLAALKTIDQAISNQLDLQSIFDIVLEQVRKTIPQAHKAIIHLWDEQQQALVPVAVYGKIKQHPRPTIRMKPQYGLAGWVMDTGKSINSGNIAREPKFIAARHTRQPKSLLVVPIQSQQDRFGTISIESAHENAFSVQDEHLISLLGIQAALAIKNARLFEREHQALQRAEAHARELETREQHLTLLNQITRAAMQSQDLPAMLQIFADRIGELFNAHGCYITLWDEATQRTIPIAAYGDKRETYPHVQVQPNEPTLTQTLLEKQKILLVDNTTANQFISQRIQQMFPTQCMLGIPLMLNEKKLGAILIDFQTLRSISPDEITLAEQAAGQIAVAIAKAHALQAEQQARQHAENLLTKLQHTQQHLIQTEKLAALGELVAGVAHELNNPLTSMILISQTIAQDPLPSPNRALLEKIGSEARRAAKIVRGLSDFARQRPLERAPIQINAIIKSTLELLAYELENANIQQQIQLDPALPLTLADPNQMQQVFINLANNARQAMHAAHGRGTLTIITRYGTAQRIPNHTHTIQICFADDGPGVSPEILGRIFDPFFTTKPLGVGTGLGLSICHGIVTEHGGQIWADASPQGGACFWVEIPHQAPIADTPIEDFAPPMGNSATVHQRILLLDDEKVVLSVLTNALRRKGYQVDAFSNGKDALAMLDKATYDLVMTDIRMPDISGLEIYEQVCQRCPHLRQRFIFITGDVIHPRTRDFLQKTGAAYLAKPFELTDLFAAVEKVFTNTTN